MDDQITFRIPRSWGRALARRARERGVPKSQLVREAVRAYLEDRTPLSAVERRAVLDRYRGTLHLDRAAIEADPLARQIRDHNWRE